MVKINLHCVFLACAMLFASTAFAASDALLAAGLDSYNEKDYESATILLKKAVAEKDCGADVYYMLIMSEIYTKDYKSAIEDCDKFQEKYSSSRLSPTVKYQQGRACHFNGDNDKAVMLLSDYCHENPKSAVYSSALYWIAECFYDDYSFETASDLYQQIVDDYPNDSKAKDAKYKLDAIAQREREQKLLDLLRVNDSEYLSAKEKYEKQLKTYESEDIAALKKQLNEANARISELEAEDAASKKKAAQAQAELETAKSEQNRVSKELDEAKAAAAKELAAKKAAQEAVEKATQDALAAERAREAERAEKESLAAREEAAKAAAEKKRNGVSEQELLELKLRAAQLQRVLDERYAEE